MDGITWPSLLLVVRHAESARNAVKKGAVFFKDAAQRDLVAGTPDYAIPLTDGGRRQARQSGQGIRLRFGAPDLVYHSGYDRTRDTAQGILEAYPAHERALIEVRRDYLLRERHAGFCYDMTEDEARAAFPFMKGYWRTQGGFIAVPPGGESLSMIHTNICLFLDRLRRDAAGKRVMLVTHGGPIRALRFELEGQTIDEANRPKTEDRPLNCGVTSYKYDPTRQTLVLTGHNTVFWT